VRILILARALGARFAEETSVFPKPTVESRRPTSVAAHHEYFDYI